MNKMSSSSLLRSLHRVTAAFFQPLSCRTCQDLSRRLLSTPSKWHGLWEPNDLKMEPDIPEFQALNVRMRGFDYPVLESYARYVHKTADMVFNLETDSWASPSKSLKVRTYHPKSTAVNEEYELKNYERTVVIEDVPSTTVPIFLQFIQKNCPEGINVSLKEPDPDEEESRFVPDYDVQQLQAEREAIASGKLRKK